MNISLASLRTTLARTLGATVLVATAAPAFADNVVVATADSASDDRVGLVIGASIDGGNIGCQNKNGDDCGNGAHPAGGFSVHVGGMISPSLALLGEAWGMGHTENDVTASQVIGTVALRAWVAPRLWLQGGFGVARSSLSFSSGSVMATDTSDTVPAVVGAIGLEVLRAPTFGVDLELRGGTGLYEDNVRIYNAALGVGVTFF
jgi:hypothetical protein